MADPTKLHYNLVPKGHGPRYGVSSTNRIADTLAWFVDLQPAKFFARTSSNHFTVIDLVRGELVDL